jgi:hypothetical protein
LIFIQPRAARHCADRPLKTFDHVVPRRLIAFAASRQKLRAGFFQCRAFRLISFSSAGFH